MRGDDIGERERRGDVVPKLPRFQRARDHGERRGALGGRDLVDEDELDGDGIGEQELRRDFRNHRSGAVNHDHRARMRDRRQQPGIGGKIKLDHGVDAAPAGQRHHPFADVLALVVDDVVGSSAPRELRLVLGADGGDHRRTGGLGELHGVMADAAGAAGDQRRAAATKTRHRDGMGGGHRRDAEAGAFGKARVVGEGDRERLRQSDVFGGGAEGTLPLAVPDPDALADPARRDTAADCIDDPRGIAVRNDPRKHDLAGASLARLDVGWIDPGCRDPDPDLARARRGRLDLADPQHVPRGTVRFIIGSAHEGRCPRFGREGRALEVTPDQSAGQRPAPRFGWTEEPRPPAPQLLDAGVAPVVEERPAQGAELLAEFPGRRGDHVALERCRVLPHLHEGEMIGPVVLLPRLDPLGAR